MVNQNIRKIPRIITIANQKGGVGKTTTAINLATCMAAVGKKVLVIDLDPQGNASTGLGIDKNQRQLGSYSLLVGDDSLIATIQHTNIKGLDIVPATTDLAGAEIELVDVENREYRLRKAVQDALPQLDYEYILIDCPPSLGLITLNALVSAHALLVPLQCEFFALEGLSQLIKTVDRIKAKLNPVLEIQGVVLTMYDRRNNLCAMVENDVRAFFGERVYKTVIPRNVRVSEAPSHGKPVLLYDHRCPGSLAYMHLAREVLKREADLLEVRHDQAAA